MYQSLSFKVGLAKENSNETYLGLTDEDFDQTPYRRYSGSQKDNMTNEQNQWHIRYVVQPAKFLDITTTVYRSNFERNWYKLDKVKYDTGSKISIASILDDPTTYQKEYSLLTGNSSPNSDALFVKNNNRSYYAKGIQGVIGLNFNF